MKTYRFRIACFALCVSLIMIYCVSGCDRGDIGFDDQTQTVSQADIKDYSSAKISYLGPKGTYTQEACEVFFEKDGEYLPYKTVPDAVKALTEGKSDYAVIPQENTIGGAVIDYLDTLIATENVSVVGEVELPITQNLLVLPETKLNDIKTVYSHKQGIAQGKEWLTENLPEANVIEVSSTAEGAKMVSESGDNTCAAIASAGCADVYSLKIIAAGIQNNDSNKTRFYVISKDPPSINTSDRFAFVASGKAEDLPLLMHDILNQELTLVAIHDRPLKTKLGEYNYLIECSGGSYRDYEALRKNSIFKFRFLGCFPVK